MDINPVVPREWQLIQSYGDGGFRVSGTRHSGSILVFQTGTFAWPVTTAAEITLESLQAVLDAAPPVEILLIGTGIRMAVLPATLRKPFREAGIMLDAMDTGAACRTYNVLLAEERRVAAALLAVG